MIGLIFLVSCAAEVAPPPVVGAKVDTLLGPAGGVYIVGDWTSAACAGRAYARNLHIEAHQEYAGVDLVSPCPKGTQCMWSGMVGFAGVWVMEGKKLQLREIGGATVPGGAHPTLIEATMEGKLVENGCVYEKGLTIPEGYTDVEVRPKIPGS